MKLINPDGEQLTISDRQPMTGGMLITDPGRPHEVMQVDGGSTRVTTIKASVLGMYLKIPPAPADNADAEAADY